MHARLTATPLSLSLSMFYFTLGSLQWQPNLPKVTDVMSQHGEFSVEVTDAARQPLLKACVCNARASRTASKLYRKHINICHVCRADKGSFSILYVCVHPITPLGNLVVWIMNLLRNGVCVCVRLLYVLVYCNGLLGVKLTSLDLRDNNVIYYVVSSLMPPSFGYL